MHGRTGARWQMRFGLLLLPQRRRQRRFSSPDPILVQSLDTGFGLLERSNGQAFGIHGSCASILTPVAGNMFSIGSRDSKLRELSVVPRRTTTIACSLHPSWRATRSPYTFFKLPQAAATKIHQLPWLPSSATTAFEKLLKCRMIFSCSSSRTTYHHHQQTAPAPLSSLGNADQAMDAFVSTIPATAAWHGSAWKLRSGEPCLSNGDSHNPKLCGPLSLLIPQWATVFGSLPSLPLCKRSHSRFKTSQASCKAFLHCPCVRGVILGLKHHKVLAVSTTIIVGWTLNTSTLHPNVEELQDAKNQCECNDDTLRKKRQAWRNPDRERKSACLMKLEICVKTEQQVCSSCVFTVHLVTVLNSTRIEEDSRLVSLLRPKTHYRPVHQYTSTDIFVKGRFWFCLKN